MKTYFFTPYKPASSPYINHFLQPDTIIPDYTNPQSWNRYAYVMNSPIGYNDPTGHTGCNPRRGDYHCKHIKNKNRGGGGSGGGGNGCNTLDCLTSTGGSINASSSSGLTITSFGQITLTMPSNIFGVTSGVSSISGDNWWSNGGSVGIGIEASSNDLLDTIKNIDQNILAYQYTPIASAAVGVLSGKLVNLSLPFIETPLGLSVFLGAIAVNRIAGGVGLASTFYQYHNNLYGTNFTDVVVSGVTYLLGWINPLWEEDTSIGSLLYSGYRLKNESPIYIPSPDSWGN